MAINALTQLHHERFTFALDVDRESRVPLYEQLRLQFRQAIQDGRLDPSEPLAPEPELAAWLGVSRFTLRQALGQLVHEGLLRRQRGRGTFIVEAPATTDLGPSSLRAVAATDVEVLEVGLSQPTADEAAALGIDPAKRIVEIVQRRSAQGRVIALERIVLDGHSLPLAGLAELAGDNLYELLEQHSGE
jgi:DNA-binding GntR family transcriptional regulator